MIYSSQYIQGHHSEGSNDNGTKIFLSTMTPVQWSGILHLLKGPELGLLCANQLQ